MPGKVFGRWKRLINFLETGHPYADFLRILGRAATQKSNADPIS